VTLSSTWNNNLWGKTDFRGDTTHFSKWGTGSTSSTTAASAWQLADDKFQTFTRGNTTAPDSTWHAQAWRLTSALDSLRFKFVKDQTYYGQAGHRFWLKGSTASTLANEWNDGSASFMFESETDAATSTLMGAVSVVATLAYTMF